MSDSSTGHTAPGPASHSRTTPDRPVDEPATGAQTEQEAVEAAAARSAMPTKDQDAPVSAADEEAALDALAGVHARQAPETGSAAPRSGATRPSPSPRAPAATPATATQDPATQDPATRDSTTRDAVMTDSTPDERSPEELRADLAVLRSDLGETVEELHHRVDVPARVKARTAETSEKVKVAAADTGALLQDRYTQGREVLAEKAPAVDRQLRERPAVVGAVALAPLVALLVVRLVRRGRAG